MNLKTPKDKRIIVIYNPYIRKYYVHFIDHDYGEEGAFDDESEWQYIDHPIYKDQHLAIQLDYDENAQLIVYFEQGDQSEYTDSISWNSDGYRNSNVIIVHTDIEFEMYKSFIDKLDLYPNVNVLKLRQ